MLKIALIVGIPAMASFVFYKRLNVFYVTDPMVKMKMGYLYRPEKAPDYLFLGSSRILHQIDPQMIESVCGRTSYNLGVEGFRMAEMRMLLEVCIEQHKIPRLFVINIDGNSFIVKEPAWNFTDILSFADADTVVYHAMAGVQDVFRCKWKYPFYRLQNLMSLNDGYKVGSLWKGEAALLRQASSFNADDTSVRSNGFAPVYAPYAETYMDPFNEKYQEESFVMLREMIELCRQKRIRVVLLTGPFYKAYRSLFLNAGYLYERVRKLADSTGVPYFNLLDDPQFQSKGDYYNLVHLNGWAAERFSMEVAKILCKVDSTDLEGKTR